MRPFAEFTGSSNNWAPPFFAYTPQTQDVTSHFAYNLAVTLLEVAKYVKATDHHRSMHENELPMIPLMRPLSLVPVDTRLLWEDVLISSGFDGTHEEWLAEFNLLRRQCIQAA